MKTKSRTKIQNETENENENENEIENKNIRKIPGYEVRHQILKYGLDMEVFESIKEKKSSEPFNHDCWKKNQIELRKIRKEVGKFLKCDDEEKTKKFFEVSEWMNEKLSNFIMELRKGATLTLGASLCVFSVLGQRSRVCHPFRK